MKIIVAEHGGFCFGVRRAVEAVHKNLSEKGIVYTYGPIIHNPQVVKDLEQKGVKIEQNIECIENGTIIIRSHGVTPQIYDEIKSKGLKLVDATCPYVKRIHEKVHAFYEQGYKVIIIGEKEHPEVVGINGWCGGEGIVLNSPEEVSNLPFVEKACVVAQTTITQEKWNEVLAVLASRIHHLEIFNTICYTTSERQREAAAIAKTVNAMLVIGGTNSSNTGKLYTLCKKYCERTFLIETVNDIPFDQINSSDVIGITAGASTPDWIIKEVVSKMNENEINNEQDMNLMEDYEKTFVSLRRGQVVKGTVVQVNDDEVSINISYKSDGIIPKKEFIADPNVNLRDVVQIGDEIEAQVVKINDGEGNVLLSRRSIEEKKHWTDLEEGFQNNKEFEGLGVEVVKGGLIAIIKGIRAFIPASQLSTHYVNEIKDYLNQTLRLRIIEMDKNKKRIVASQRVVLEEEADKAKKALWDSLNEGDTVMGTVQRLTNFGAFVDLGGVDGLIHISDLSWGRVKHPSDVLKPGDKVDVRILSLDREKGRISLGYKQTKPQPWDVAMSKYTPNMVTEGRVVRLANFGAFVELEPGLDGLVHISQLSHQRVNKVEDVIKAGDIVKVKVLDVNPDDKRISLSIKEATPMEKENKEEKEPIYQNESIGVTLGEFFPVNDEDTDKEDK